MGTRWRRERTSRVNRHLCNNTKETLKCPWDWVGRDTSLTDSPYLPIRGELTL